MRSCTLAENLAKSFFFSEFLHVNAILYNFFLTFRYTAIRSLHDSLVIRLQSSLYLDQQSKHLILKRQCILIFASSFSSHLYWYRGIYSYPCSTNCAWGGQWQRRNFEIHYEVWHSANMVHSSPLGVEFSRNFPRRVHEVSGKPRTFKKPCFLLSTQHLTSTCYLFLTLSR